MSLYRQLTGLGLLLCVAGCSLDDPIPPADVVFLNGKVFTSEPVSLWAEAVAVEDDHIVFVGDEQVARAYIGERTRVVDIGEGLLIPGFMDSHTHIFNGSFADIGVNLSLADTLEKLQTALEQIREDHPGDDPIYARGWQNHLFPKQGPLASELDTLFGDRIVILGSVDGHSTWFSSRALREAGVDSDFVDPKPGVRFFERDRLTNAPLGTDREGAGGFIRARFIPGDAMAYEERLRRWLPRAAASGLTSVFDATAKAPTEIDAYDILNTLDTAGELTLRVFASVLQDTSPETIVQRFAQYQQQFSTDYVRPEAVKIVVDGVPEGHTAFLLTPYVDGSNEDFGHPMMSLADLQSQISHYFSNDIPVHLHAIGGAAIRMSLDAIATARVASGNDTVRATIAHMDFVSEQDLQRFEQLNVTAQTSIQWAARDPSYFNIGAFVGMDKVESAYPVKALLDAGANQTFGADWPASAYLSTYKPLELIETAVSRRLPGQTSMPPRAPNQALSLETALIAMTRNTAIQLGEGDRLGTLAKGKKADIVMLAQNVFEVDVATIHSVGIRMTMLDGAVIYENDGAE